MQRPEARDISRRTVALGAAWSVPVIAAAHASPAFAASPELVNDPTLQGKINHRKTCDPAGYHYRSALYPSGYKVLIDQVPEGGKTVTDVNGNPVSYGFYVLDGAADHKPTAASMTIYFPVEYGSFTFTNLAPRSGWTALTRDDNAPSINGLVAYTTSFVGTWVWDSSASRWVTVGSEFPRWGANPSGLAYDGTAQALCPDGTMRWAITRSVTIDGRKYLFTRRQGV